MNRIPNIRTIKALRGDPLNIDLGKEFIGSLKAYMRKDSNSATFRSFDIIDNRFLYLPKSKTSDYKDALENIIESIEGKWYFDVELTENVLEPEKTYTIFRGIIFFQNDITNNSGDELLLADSLGKSFLTLSDTPTLWGDGGQILQVNALENALEWVTPSSSGSGFSGNYNDLANKPTLFSEDYNDLLNKPTLFSGNYIDLTNKPTLFSGNYIDLTNKPTLFSEDYNDLANKPTLFSEDYNDLTNKPIIPTQVIVDDTLTSTDTTSALSSNQGRILNEKISKIDDIKEVLANRDLSNDDASGLVYLESGITINFPTTILTNTVFNFWVNTYAIADATITFDSSLIGEDGNNNIPNLVLNAGSKILIFKKSDGKICISD